MSRAMSQNDRLVPASSVFDGVNGGGCRPWRRTSRLPDSSAAALHRQSGVVAGPDCSRSPPRCAHSSGSANA
jgi:hypothetical protein